MRKISMFAAVATLAAVGFGMWAVPSTDARVTSVGQGIDPVQLMLNAKGLATAEVVDYTFVFH
jgi:hypothetical protein